MVVIIGVSKWLASNGAFISSDEVGELNNTFFTITGSRWIYLVVVWCERYPPLWSRDHHLHLLMWTLSTSVITWSPSTCTPADVNVIHLGDHVITIYTCWCERYPPRDHVITIYTCWCERSPPRWSRDHHLHLLMWTLSTSVITIYMYTCWCERYPPRWSHDHHLHLLMWTLSTSVITIYMYTCWCERYPPRWSHDHHLHLLMWTLSTSWSRDHHLHLLMWTLSTSVITWSPSTPADVNAIHLGDHVITIYTCWCERYPPRWSRDHHLHLLMWTLSTSVITWSPSTPADVNAIHLGDHVITIYIYNCWCDRTHHNSQLKSRNI